jgi:RNA polymerase primary sigma factor
MTAAERDSLTWYLDRIGKLPLLTPNEEAALAGRVAWGLRALEELAQATELSVEVLARHFRLKAQDRPDLEALRARRFPGERERVEAALRGLPKPLRPLVGQALEGARAWVELVERNLRLAVRFTAHRFGHGLEDEDVVQEANLGLARAVSRFDPRQGTRFSTYATWWIRQATSRSLATSSRAVRLPHDKHDALTKLYGTRTRLQGELGRDPTEEELAQALGLPLERLRELLVLEELPLSLDTPVGEEKDGLFGDLLPSARPGPEEAALRRLEEETLEKALAKLDERTRKALNLRFGLDGGGERTLEEVGRALGVSRERARQIVVAGLRCLAQSVGADWSP